MDYGNPITKDDIREIIHAIPPGLNGQDFAQMLMDLLTRQMIEATPYTYSAVFAVAGAGNSIAAGATSPVVNVGIQADADFLILNQTYNCNSANAAQTASTRVYPNATVLLTDSGSGYQMMDQAVPVTSIFGDGQFPYILQQPKLLKAKANLQVQVTNTDVAQGIDLYLNFNGVKLTKYNS